MAKSSKRGQVSAWLSIAKILFLAISVVNCGQPATVQVPKDVIQKEEMIEILTDIHLVEGAKAGQKIMGDTFSVDDYYAKVYAKHDVTPEHFDDSYKFYTSHPTIMDGLYQKVVENLTEIQERPEKDLDLRAP